MHGQYDELLFGCHGSGRTYDQWHYGTYNMIESEVVTGNTARDFSYLLTHASRAPADCSKQGRISVR